MFIASLSLENSFGQFQAETSNFKNVDILILKCTRWPFMQTSYGIKSSKNKKGKNTCKFLKSF